jgi:trimeric autotransporter adhesin
MLRKILFLIGLFSPFTPVTSAQAIRTIQTIVGGLPNNYPATQAAIGSPMSVVKDPAGNLYVASGSGYNYEGVGGAVFKIDPNGIITTVAGNDTLQFEAPNVLLPSFNNGDGGLALNASLGPILRLFVDSKGDLYIADTRRNTIREVISSTGIITTIAGGGSGCANQTDTFGDGCPATSAILNTPYQVFVDANQNIFIADSGNSLIREVAASTGLIQTVAGGGHGCMGTDTAGDGCPATLIGLSDPVGVYADNIGNLFIADAGASLIRKVTAPSGIIQTIAGTGNNGFNGDGSATSANLNFPQGLFVDSFDNVYFADSSNYRVREIVASTGLIQTIAGGTENCNAQIDILGDGCPATASSLNFPTDVYVDSLDDVYIADSFNRQVREVGSNGIIQSIAGTVLVHFGGEVAFGGDGQSANVAQVEIPYSVAFDASGNLFIAEYGNGLGLIREVTAATGLIQTVGGGLEPGLGCTQHSSDGLGDGCPATQSWIGAPTSVFFDSSGNLYISDSNESRIRMISGSTSFITSVIGGGSGCPNQTDTVGDGCLAAQALISFPWGLYVDANGNIFFSDNGNARVRELVASTGLVQTIAGGGTSGYSDNVPAAQVQLSSPTDLYGDAFGNIFFADSGLHRILEIVISTGNIVTVAGTGQQGYNGDGIPASSAEIGNPYGVYVDRLGNIFFGDLINYRVREVVAATGLIQTVAGNGIFGFSGDGGPATSAAISAPTGFTSDANGNLYIADAYNNRVREVFGIAAASQLSITTRSLSNGQVGTPYDVSLQDSGGSPPFTWSITSGALPNGLGLNTSTGIISGIPTTSGSFPITAQVTDSAASAQIASANYTLTIASASLVSIATTPANASIATGTSQQFTATGNYSDGSMQDLTSNVTWGSDMSLVATINGTGLASGVGPGTTTIRATSGTTSGSTTLTVTAPVQTLLSITVTPANSSIVPSSTQRFVATGTYSDGSSQDLTAAVAWASADLTISTISNSAGSQGLAMGIATGVTTVSATLGSLSSTSTLTVNFAVTGNLNTTRFAHTATLLNNGQVLIAGGIDANGNSLGGAELFDPSTGAFTPTGNLNTMRAWHTATLLNNGTVLIAGGCSNCPPGYNGTSLADAEIYNPSTGIFMPTGSMKALREYQTATLLTNGKVLITGGAASGSPLGSAELYDPATGIFSGTQSLNTARYFQTSTLLNDGTVLITGGETSGYNQITIAEIYNPSAGDFTPLFNNMIAGRALATATLLNNGTVLIAGGFNAGNSLATAELYDPVAGTFTATRNLNSARWFQKAMLLSNGTVLIAGGFDPNSNSLSSAELYDSSTGTFAITGGLNTARYGSTLTLLNNGMVLATGGLNATTYLASAELYEPSALAPPPNLVSISLSPSSPTIPLYTAQRFTATGTFNDNSTESLASVTWSSSNIASVSITDDATDLGAAYAATPGSAMVSACAGSICGNTLLTVGPPLQPQTITFTLSASTVTYGSSPITLSAAVSSGLPVTFTVISGPGTVSGITLSVNGAGAIVIEADQAGNSNYSAAPPVQQTLTVSQASPVITWADPPAITYGISLTSAQLDASASVPGNFVYSPAVGAILGAGTQTLSVTFTPTDAIDYATATSTAALIVNKATPTVNFNGAPGAAGYLSTFVVSTTSNATSVATVTATGACSITGNTVTMISGTGVCNLSANWAADSDYVARSATQNTTATKIQPTIVFTGAPATAGYNSSFTVSATTNASTTAAIAASGACTIAGATVTVSAPSGSCSLNATWAADNNYLAAFATQSTMATLATPTINWTTPTTITYGTALSGTQLDAKATYNGATLAGTFVYTPAKGTVLTAGAQTLSVTFTPTKTADYTIASASVTLLVTQATPKITWAKPAAITYGTALSSTQLNATANVPGLFAYTPPSGTVLNAGTQTLSVGITPTDSTDYTTASSSVTIAVNKASTTSSLTEAPSASLLGQPVTFTATVSSPSGITVFGTVTFKQGATVLGTASLGSSSIATFTTSGLSVGSPAVTASYAATTNFAASTSTSVTETVSKLPTATSVGSSSNPTKFGSSVTFTAAVGVASGTNTSFTGAPTGSVSFYDGTKKLGGGTLSGTGVATFSITTLARGSHSITAVYAGNSNFVTSTSGVVVQAVN